jgi:hypothetical protein
MHLELLIFFAKNFKRVLSKEFLENKQDKMGRYITKDY